jgi:CHAT domain-containing protein
MDEQRIQAYVDLIEQLLGCPQGEEVAVLQAHAGLVDAGLVEVMEQYAAHLESQGNSNAGWLRGFAAQLAQALGTSTVPAPIGASDRQAAAQFLAETLQLVEESNGDAQQIYPMWAEQQAQLNEALLEILPQFGTHLLEQNPEHQSFFAYVLVIFGILIQQFPLGTRWLNLELGIAAYEQALTVRTQANLPIEWAEITNNLAAAYADRIKGDRTKSIEEETMFYEQALTVRTQANLPIEWATTTMNLALAYSDRIKGDRAENIERAIAGYEQALTVMTQAAMPIEWATTTMNLALAYSNRIKGDQAENLEQAIGFYEQALTVRTQANLPIEWAETTMNLATAYANRINGDRAENLEQAITSYEQALTVMTQAAMPIDWAQTTNNLAATYAERIKGDRAENIERAISAYRSSLEIFTPIALPDDCRRTARLLANLYSDQARWAEAAASYPVALTAAEICYQRSDLLDSKASELSTTADLPRRAAYAYAKVGKLQAAALTLEQGRARGLSESLDRDRASLDNLQQNNLDLYSQYKALTEQLRNLENQQRDRSTSSDRHSLTPENLRNTAISLRQQLDSFIRDIRQVSGYEKFLTLPTFEEVHQPASSDRLLVYLVTTPAGGLALIVTPKQIEPVWLDALNETQLIDLLSQTWFAAYNQSRTNSQGWYDAIATVTGQLWEPLMHPLIQYLKNHNFHEATLIPTGYLSLLPLHAAWTEDWTEDPRAPTGKRYALDEIHFTYAPNAKSLTAAGAIAAQVNTESMLAIDNPRNDLPNSEREVKSAIASFLQSTVLRHDAATVDAVRSKLPEVAIAHFSCHGTANLTDPLNSGLQMSDGLLTLKDIFGLNLAEGDRGLRLAILSACETGLIGIENADEAVSLPTGLLQAGVAAVIASLWSVSDLSTMLLLSKFYDLWRKQSLPPDQALRQAQIWLRDSTNGEIAEAGLLFIPPNTPPEIVHQRPYAHPFHWAAFSYTGI